jgi:hypothetical protein
MLDKLYAAARVIALLVAIAGAFVAVPSASLVLVVLGIVIGFGVSSDDSMRYMLAALVLSGGAKVLEVVPQAGPQLAGIVSNVGAVATAAAITAIAISLVLRIKSDWVK